MNEYRYTDIEIGYQESFNVVIDRNKMNMFQNITGDKNPLHINNDFANMGGFDGRVVYGFLVASFYSTLAGVYLPGKWSLIFDVELGMASPVYIGDELCVSGKVIDKDDAFQLITLRVSITNQGGKKVSKGKMRVKVRK